MCYWQCNAYNSYINWVWHSSDVKHGTGCYLDEAFQLVVLCQELCLFLLQGEDVVRCLLQDGRLMEKEKKMRIVHGQITWCSHKTVAKAEMKLKSIFFYVSVFAGCCFFCTLLSFSPSVWGRSVLRDWKPALMLCMRRRSLLLAISRRIRLSWSWAVSGLRGMLARLRKRGQKERRSSFCPLCPMRRCKLLSDAHLILRLTQVLGKRIQVSPYKLF